MNRWLSARVSRKPLCPFSSPWPWCSALIDSSWQVISALRRGQQQRSSLEWHGGTRGAAAVSLNPKSSRSCGWSGHTWHVITCYCIIIISLIQYCISPFVGAVRVWGLFLFQLMVCRMSIRKMFCRVCCQSTWPQLHPGPLRVDWNINCESGLVSQHQCWTFLLFYCLSGNKSTLPGFSIW